MIKLLLLLPFTMLFAYEPVAPIPLQDNVNKEKALLGKDLFFETSLSKDGSVSCFHCHNVYNGGADPRKVSLGFADQAGNIQSPTVLNARYNFKQFWNGRADDLHEQANGPLLNPIEHNMDQENIEYVLNASQKYKDKFAEVYKTDQIRYEDVIDAIVEFEKALITPNAKFDRYLRGEIDLEPDEKQGYKLFKQYGCVTCHNGINIGGNSFQKMGTFIPYRSLKEYPDRKALTKKPDHENVFKVPTLRNIALTSPYFHDATTESLDEAIKLMSHYNLGIQIPDQDIKKIVLFLHTLTGETPKILDMQ